MRWRRGLGLLAALGVLMSLSAPAQAATNLTGRWDSNSLRDNRVGYYFQLSPVKNMESQFVGTFRFIYRGGRQGSNVPVIAKVSGASVIFEARKGAFDRSSGLLRGEISANATRITMTNCQARLRLAMANDLASDCVFRLRPTT